MKYTGDPQTLTMWLSSGSLKKVSIKLGSSQRDDRVTLNKPDRGHIQARGGRATAERNVRVIFDLFVALCQVCNGGERRRRRRTWVRETREAEDTDERNRWEKERSVSCQDGEGERKGEERVYRESRESEGESARRWGGSESRASGSQTVRVRAQYGDSQDEVHHDREKDHAEAQQYGSVLSCPQSCHCLPLVQDLIFTNLLVDWSKEVLHYLTFILWTFYCMTIKT